MQHRKVKRALLSVSNKSGLLDLASKLVENGVEIIASDGTAAFLRESKISVRTVTEVTGSPEMLGGRVKTLHPLIHGAILASDHDGEEVARLGIGLIDLVVINFYPSDFFDIGGPALVRAAAKNYERVSIITGPDQYLELTQSLEQGSDVTSRKRWARRAIEMTAKYDLEILRDLGSELRYGENPHQRGWVSGSGGLAEAPLLQGKAMSYNNYLDADSALNVLRDFELPSVVIIKHGIPAGIASADSIESAFEAALACDPVSAFGGVIASNRIITQGMASAISESFFEVIVAPDFESKAQEVLAAKKSLRLIALPDWKKKPEIQSRGIDGGFIFQTMDDIVLGDDPKTWTLVSGQPMSDLEQLHFAWRAVRAVRSNAIVISQDLATVGIGSGQVNRMDAAQIAVMRAGNRAKGACAASDAFFPFADGLQILIDAGVKAVVQPGGSVRDDEVIEIARSAGITMYLTGTRHFSHN